MKNNLIVLFLSIFGMTLHAQEHFLVEFEPVSPPIEEMIKGHIGYPAIPIMANDIAGVNRSISELKGKTVFLYFWNKECPTCFDHLDILHRMQKEHSDDLQILSFSDEDKATSLQLADEWQIKFPIIPSSRVIADGPFTKGLGYPRLFVIDEYGVVKIVLSQENFETQGFLFEKVEKQCFSDK